MANKTVTIRLSGGDYTSLSAAYSAEFTANSDLTAAGMDGILTFLIEGDWSSTADATAIDFYGFVTDSTHYVVITTDSANRAGTSYSASKYRLEAGSLPAGGTLTLRSSYTRVIGLQVRDTTGANWSSIRVLGGTSTVIDSCLAHNSGWYGFDVSGGATGAVFVNCVSIGSARQGLVIDGSSTAYADNCTIEGAPSTYNGIDVVTGSTLTATNCYSGNNGGNDYNATGTLNLVTCASEDATGSLALRSIAYSASTFANVGSGSEDFSLVTGSPLIAVGTDMSANSHYPFNWDITGATRTAWDVGADYFYSAPVIPSIEDAVWTHPVRTLDPGVPPASDGSLLDNIAYAIWTRAVRTLTGGGGTAYTRSLADSIGITHVLNRIWAVRKAIANTVGITHVLNRVWSARKVIADTVGITHSLSAIKILLRSISNTVGITHTISKITGFRRSTASSVGITHTLGRVWNIRKTITNTVGITDAISKIKGFVRSIANTIGITHSLVAKKIIARLISNTVGMSDTFSRLLSYRRQNADTASITMTLSRVKASFRSIANTVGITMVLTRVRGVFRSLMNTVSITMSNTRKAGYNRIRVETVMITHTLSKVIGYARRLYSTATSFDWLMAGRKLTVFVSDTVAILELLVVKILRRIRDALGTPKLFSSIRVKSGVSDVASISVPKAFDSVRVEPNVSDVDSISTPNNPESTTTGVPKNIL